MVNLLVQIFTQQIT